MASGLGDQGLKLVLTSGVEAQSSENIDEDRSSNTFSLRSRAKVLAFVCYLCEKQNRVCLLFMTNEASPRSNTSNVLSPFGFGNSQSVILTRHSV